MCNITASMLGVSRWWHKGKNATSKWSEPDHVEMPCDRSHTLIWLIRKCMTVAPILRAILKLP